MASPPSICVGKRQRRQDRDEKIEEGDRRRKSAITFSQQVESMEAVPRIMHQVVRPVEKVPAGGSGAAPAPFSWQAAPPAGFQFGQSSSLASASDSTVNVSSKAAMGVSAAVSKASRQPGNVDRHVEDEDEDRVRKSSLTLLKTPEKDDGNSARQIRHVNRVDTVGGEPGGHVPITFRFGSSKSQAGHGGVFRFQSTAAPVPSPPVGVASHRPAWAGFSFGLLKVTAGVPQSPDSPQTICGFKTYPRAILVKRGEVLVCCLEPTEELLEEEKATVDTAEVMDPVPAASPAYCRNSKRRREAENEEWECKSTLRFKDEDSLLPCHIRRAIEPFTEQSK